MKIAICDDEKIYIDTILLYFNKISKRYEKKCDIFTCQRGDQLIDMCNKTIFDAVFLDISMPGMNGFETAEKLLKIRNNMSIVFVSSKESMVFSSYEYKPFWFVPKSQMAMLEIVIAKLFEKIDADSSESTLIAINIEMNKVIELDLKQIAYFKTNDHYIQFAYKDQSDSTSYRNKMDHIEMQLSKYYFVRIHNRYLVNCRLISEIEKNLCKLINGVELPISRAKMSHTKEIFQNYLRSIR